VAHALLAIVGVGCDPEQEQERVRWSEPYFTVTLPKDEACTANVVGNGRTEVSDAESLPDGVVVVAGRVDDGCRAGFITQIAPDGGITHRRVGAMIDDVAFDDGLVAIGWADGGMFWRVPSDGSEPTPFVLPDSGASAEPKAVLPGPIIVGLHNPITPGVLNGWIVRREGDAWRETMEHGGGYSAFWDATAIEGGFAAVGFASGQKPYEGWLVVHRDGTRTEQRFGEEHQMADAIVRLPDEGLLVVGHGRGKSFAIRFDDSLTIVDRTDWPVPSPNLFEYAQLVVHDDTAWAVALHGTLREEFSSITLVELPLAAKMGPAKVHPIPSATGGALLARPDGSLWLVTAVAVPDVGAPGRAPTGPIAFARLRH
jgi:hypothetical protein